MIPLLGQTLDISWLEPIAQLLGFAGITAAYWWQVVKRDPAVHAEHTTQIKALVDQLAIERERYERLAHARAKPQTEGAGQ